MTTNTKPQPPPKPSDLPAVWPLVIADLDTEAAYPLPKALLEAVTADMQARDDVGRAKYGTPLQTGNGRDNLADAYQEALDMAVYLKAHTLEGGDPRLYHRALEWVVELRRDLLERDGR